MPVDLWLPPKPAIIRPALGHSFRGPAPRKLIQAPFTFPVAFWGGTVADLELTASPASQFASQSSYTFSNAAIGTAPAAGIDRYVIVVMFSMVNVAGRTLSSITIGGNTATLDVSGAGGVPVTNTVLGAIARILLNTGTTATVVGNFSGNMASCFCQVYTMVGAQSGTPHHTASSFSTSNVGSRSVSINIPAAGALLAGAGNQAASGALSFTGVAEQVEQETLAANCHSGRDENQTAETGRTVTSTSDGATGAYGLVAASWQ